MFEKKESTCIFLVEDEREIREVFADRLRSEGFIVIESKNGSEAFDCIRFLSPKKSILISDFNMPQMNGVELIRQIDLKKIPIEKYILISGNPCDSKIQQLVSEKLNKPLHVFSKPMEIDVILSLLTVSEVA